MDQRRPKFSVVNCREDNAVQLQSFILKIDSQELQKYPIGKRLPQIWSIQNTFEWIRSHKLSSAVQKQTSSFLDEKHPKPQHHYPALKPYPLLCPGGAQPRVPIFVDLTSYLSFVYRVVSTSLLELPNLKNLGAVTALCCASKHHFDKS